MTRPLEEAVQARWDQLARQRIEVPEWGPAGEPFVFWSLPFTLADQALLAEWQQDDPARATARLLVHKGETEAGEPIGDLATVLKLKVRAEAHVMERITRQILAGTSLVKPRDELIEDAAGN